MRGLVGSPPLPKDFWHTFLPRKPNPLFNIDLHMLSCHATLLYDISGESSTIIFSPPSSGLLLPLGDISGVVWTVKISLKQLSVFIIL
jgi:hypothetical protein